MFQDKRQTFSDDPELPEVSIPLVDLSPPLNPLTPLHHHSAPLSSSTRSEFFTSFSIFPAKSSPDKRSRHFLPGDPNGILDGPFHKQSFPSRSSALYS